MKSAVRTMRAACAMWLLCGVLCATGASSAVAQEPFEEQPDPTRLDVERLPPEAIEVTRDLYAHGIYMDAWLGARGFVGGIGDVSNAGPLAHVGVGYELFPWLLAGVAFEFELHGTAGPRPPAPTVFEILGLVADLRAQFNFSSRFAVWLGGEVGAHLVLSDVLVTYGVKDATDIGLMFGGNLGVDWHFVNAHTSIGLLGGARLYPSLQNLDGNPSIGIHGAAYLRYVF